MPIDFVPFTDDLLGEASVLLAQQHRANRTVLPMLPARYEDPAFAFAALSTAWRRPHVNGIAAVERGRLQGYMIGEMVLDAVWGRSAWVRLPGLALAPGQPADLAQDLYAHLGAQWVACGCFTHVMLVSAAQPALVDSWFALSFGMEKVHALAALDDHPDAEPPPGIEIRRAGPADADTLASLSDLIWRHQVQAPDWGIILPERVADESTAWAELAHESTATVWLAFEHGQAVGSQGYFPAESFDDELLIPEQCVYLTIAATRAEVRGRGVARALTRRGFQDARSSGYSYCLTSWRSTNLLAARFWPQQGFRPVAYRLVRRVDPRIAWANGRSVDR